VNKMLLLLPPMLFLTRCPALLFELVRKSRIR
jgi:hypothetical protein